MTDEIRKRIEEEFEIVHKLGLDGKSFCVKSAMMNVEPIYRRIEELEDELSYHKAEEEIAKDDLLAEREATELHCADAVKLAKENDGLKEKLAKAVEALKAIYDLRLGYPGAEKFKDQEIAEKALKEIEGGG